MSHLDIDIPFAAAAITPGCALKKSTNNDIHRRLIDEFLSQSGSGQVGADITTAVQNKAMPSYIIVIYALSYALHAVMPTNNIDLQRVGSAGAGNGS